MIGEVRYCPACRTMIVATLLDVPHFCPVCGGELETIDIDNFAKLLRCYALPTIRAISVNCKHNYIKPNVMIIFGRDSP